MTFADALRKLGRRELILGQGTPPFRASFILETISSEMLRQQALVTTEGVQILRGPFYRFADREPEKEAT